MNTNVDSVTRSNARIYQLVSVWQSITDVDFVTFSNILHNEVNVALRYTDGLCIENVVLPGGGEVNVLIFPFKNGKWSANICGNKDDVVRALFLALNGKMPR